MFSFLSSSSPVALEVDGAAKPRRVDVECSDDRAGHRQSCNTLAAGRGRGTRQQPGHEIDGALDPDFLAGWDSALFADCGLKIRYKAQRSAVRFISRRIRGGHRKR